MPEQERNTMNKEQNGASKKRNAKKKTSVPDVEIDEELRKLCVFRVRMDVEEKAQLFVLSKEDGLKASQWLRVCIVEAWKKRGGEEQAKKTKHAGSTT